MIKKWKSCCYIVLITILFAVGSENLCTKINERDVDLKPFLHENIAPDSSLLGSQKLHRVDKIGDALACSGACCKDKDCQSIFFHKGDCFLVRCSFVRNDTDLCPSGFAINASESLHLSNWSWVDVKESLNDGLDVMLERFRDEKLQPREDEPTSLMPDTDKPDGTTLPTLTSFNDSTFPSPSQLTSSSSSSSPLSSSSSSTAGQASGNPVLPTEPPRLTAMATTAAKTKTWTVSAGASQVSRVPNNNFTLQATISPKPPDDEKGLYSYQWVMMSSPPKVESGQMDDMTSPSLKLTMLHEGNYTLKVIVTRGGQVNEALVNVTLLPPAKKNEPPMAKIMPSTQKLNQQNDLVLDGSESSDDEGIVSYKWEQVSGPAMGSFPTDTTFDRSVFKLKGPLTAGLYRFRLTVVDSNGESNETEATVEVIKEQDYPPKANAGSNQILYLPTNEVTLMGNESYDDRGVVSYEWTKVSNDLVNDMTGATSPFLHLSNLQVGDYTFTLTVTDASSQTDKAEVHVIVKPARNQPPVADAGANQTLFLPLAAVDLDASNSSDDNKIVSYHWTVVDGPDKPRIENANHSRAQLLNPSVGVYILRLDVADEMQLKASARVYMTVKQNPNVAPVADAGGDLEVDLDRAVVVVINGSSSYDDRGISRWSWTRDNKSPAAGFPLMNSDRTPVLRLIDLVRGRYTWTLEVTDKEGLTGRSHMVLTVKKGPMEDSLVRLVLGVELERFTGLYKEALQSHLEDLVKKNFGDSAGSRVTLSRLSQDALTGRTVIDFYVESTDRQGQWRAHLGDEIEGTLKHELVGFLEFPVVDIFSVVCHRNCSGHGKCDQVTRRCVCDTFWTPNWFKANYGSRETNCDWSVLYVTIIVVALVAVSTLLLWYAAYSVNRRLGRRRRCRQGRGQASARKRHHRYHLLDEEAAAVAASNGIKVNGSAIAGGKQRNFYSNKEEEAGLHPSKVLTVEDQSDSNNNSSSSSSEDMIFSRLNNGHKLRTIHRGGSKNNNNSNNYGNSKPSDGVTKKKGLSDDGEERHWLKSQRVDDSVGRFS